MIVVTQASVQFYKNYKVTIQILDQETRGFGSPAALNLDASGSILLWRNRDKVVTWSIPIVFVTVDALNQKLAKNQKFSSFGF